MNYKTMIKGITITGIAAATAFGIYTTNATTQSPDYRNKAPMIEQTYLDTDGNGLYDSVRIQYPTHGVLSELEREITAEEISQQNIPPMYKTISDEGGVVRRFSD